MGPRVRQRKYRLDIERVFLCVESVCSAVGQLRSFAFFLFLLCGLTTGKVCAKTMTGSIDQISTQSWEGVLRSWSSSDLLPQSKYGGAVGKPDILTYVSLYHWQSLDDLPPESPFLFPCDWLHGLHLGGGGILVDLSRRRHLLGVTNSWGWRRELVCLLGRLRRYPTNVFARSNWSAVSDVDRWSSSPSYSKLGVLVRSKPYSWDVELAVRLLRTLVLVRSRLERLVLWESVHRDGPPSDIGAFAFAEFGGC